MLKSNTGRLVVLTLVHFSVDFCGGLMIPLPEPTLTAHLGVGLPTVAALLGGCALLVNIVQPISAWLLPRDGAPLLLVIAPLAAALTACLGVSDSLWVVGAMLVVASLGIGIVHPEAAIAAHSVSGSRVGFGISLFMSGGYFGFALGSLVSGVWVEYQDQGLARFWILGLPAVCVALLVVWSGLHRLTGHMKEDSAGKEGRLPFPLAAAVAVAIGIEMCVLVRFIPIYLVRMFPGQNGQGWGGATVFATGVTGALGSFLWGTLSEGRRRGLFVSAAQILGAPFLVMLLRVDRPSLAPLWGLGVGATLGAVFPLSVVLARGARGASQRLRVGLAIGGAWGMGEVAFILGGRYVGTFPEGAVEPVRTVLHMCLALLGVTCVTGLLAARFENGVNGGDK